MKAIKDSRQSVRYNSVIYEKLKKQGWTIQKLLDWAIEQNIKIELSAKKISTGAKKE